MTDKAEKWVPAPATNWFTPISRLISFTGYPTALPFVLFDNAPATAESCIWHRNFCAALVAVGGVGAHLLVWRKWGDQPMSKPHVYAHASIGLFWDHAFLWFGLVCHELAKVFKINRDQSRLNAGNLHGPRVLVVGNGPSAMQGVKLGTEIDKFDEVVRFNNFQCKAAGLSEWVGTKTTVHFSDGVLYPTFKEYHVPGATVILSLIADRMIVGFSYFIQRGVVDFYFDLTKRFLYDPKISYISKESIERVKRLLGIASHKHPTSGMLAIDHFVNMSNVQLPVIIHGFDFFQGPTIHYYHKQEPLFERVNNRIGVNMHSPHLEKVYVEKLIAEGKVQFLKDMPKYG